MQGHFRLGPWLVRSSLNTATRNGTMKRLTPKAMEVLVCLAEHAGEPVAKEKLVERVWPETFVGDDALKGLVAEIRRVLEDDAKEPRIIETIPKRGYRLIAPVEWQDRQPETQPGQTRSAIVGFLAKPNRKLWVSGLAIFASALFLMLFAGANLDRVRNWLRPRPSAQIHSIAVLPLRNLSTDVNQEYLCDGLTDGLITDLAQIDSLKVISHTSTMQYKDTKKTLPEIAHELNVDGIIEGTVQRSGNRLLVTAQLVHAPIDKHLWADSYERDMQDVFLLEREVAGDIARQIQTRLTTESQPIVSPRKPTNLNALDAYLQGNFHLNKYGRGSGVEEASKAAEYFQRAIAADPEFVPAYIGMARAHDDLPHASHENRVIERRAVEKILQLDPNSQEAHLIQADIKWEEWDWWGAEEEFRRVIALNPNNADAHHQLCLLLSHAGRLEEAMKDCQVAQELDPNNDHLSELLYERGDNDRAIAIRRMMIERHPDDGAAHYGLSQFYAQKGMYKDSVEELAKVFELYGYPETSRKIRGAFAVSGYQGAMRQAAEKLEHLHATEQWFVPVNLADIYAALGEKDRALYWLEQAYAHHDMIEAGFPADYMGVDPMLVSLRSDQRFQNLLRGMRLPP